MESVKQRFRDLDSVIDGTHRLFEDFPLEGGYELGLTEEALYRAKLAVHEWIANLVQHADFGDRQADISVDVWSDGRRIECVIEDNSEGFDLDEHLEARKGSLNALPERGMGLLMLRACASDLYYGRIADGRFRLKFSVSADDDPWLNIPF